MRHRQVECCRKRIGKKKDNAKTHRAPRNNLLSLDWGHTSCLLSEAE